MNKHIHYDAIVAWANGEQIQLFSQAEKKWKDLESLTSPVWFPENQYRIKPKEVKLVPHWHAIIANPPRLSAHIFPTKEAATLTFPRNVLRLATEYPAVLLPEKEPIPEYHGPGWPGR